MDIDETILKKVKQAENLSKIPRFPFSLFKKVDYYSAADLYVEVAKLELSRDNFENVGFFYNKAAENYEMSDEFGCKNQAMHYYIKSGDAYFKVDEDKTLQNYRKAAELANVCGSYSIGGSVLMKMYEILNKKVQSKNKFIDDEIEENVDLKPNHNILLEISQILENTIKFYERSNMMISARSVKEKLAWNFVYLENYRSAGNLFLELNTDNLSGNQNLLCAFFCYYLTGAENLMENVKITIPVCDEKKIISAFYEDNMVEIVRKEIDSYLDKHFVKDEFKEFMDSLKSKLQPNFDIL